MNEKDTVREQYEALPYPPREPTDEFHRLNATVLDSLALINQYGYAGRGDFSSEFRALVAGGGTGDAAIHLAEQLRGSDASVVYVDFSEGAMRVARERARIRGLKNIEWRNASLMDLPKYDDDGYDFINCSGVLHHLEDRQAGLDALAGVLKEDGLMAIMVYSRHMRAPVYQMQELVRRATKGVVDTREKIRTARELIENLPPTNLFKAQILRHKGELQAGDAAIYDLLLHSRDEPFSVPELYAWLDASNLSLIEFVSPIGQKINYRPETFIRDPAVLRRLAKLERRERHAIAELISLASANHAFYCAPQSRTPPRPDSRDMVPFFFPHQEKTPEMAKELTQRMQETHRAGESLQIDLQFTSIKVPNESIHQAIARLIDGQRTVGRIVDQAASDAHLAPINAQKAFTDLYEALNAFDWMLLRHESVAPFMSAESLQARMRDSIEADG